jgi:hypothetical protein
MVEYGEQRFAFACLIERAPNRCWTSYRQHSFSQLNSALRPSVHRSGQMGRCGSPTNYDLMRRRLRVFIGETRLYTPLHARTKK